MIRIIDTLQAQSLDRQDGVWHRLALIPATATIERSEKVEEAGRLATIKINASLSESSEVLRDNLVIKVGFCHGGQRDLRLGGLAADVRDQRDKHP